MQVKPYFAALICFVSITIGGVLAEAGYSKSTLNNVRQCDVGNESACEKVLNACLKKNGELCRWLAATRYEQGNKTATLKLMKIACEQGDKEGCDITRDQEDKDAQIKVIEAQIDRISAQQERDERANRRSRERDGWNQTNRTSNSPTLDDWSRTPNVQQTQNVECETQPMRDIYTGKITKYRSNCH